MKICHCKKKLLLDYLYSRKTPLSNELVAAQIASLLESDCVCEKKSSCSEIPNNSPTCQCRYHNEDCKGEVKESGVCADCPPNCFTENKKLLGTDLEYEVARTVVRMENDLAYLKDQIEKQPQSTCEHEFIRREVPDADDINNYNFIFYCCYECGLVTCKNPNE